MADTPPFVLPPENSDEGAMARLFINEAAGPHGTAALAVRAMGWMKRVLANRLEHPAQFDAPGATRLRRSSSGHQG
jgi:hypothetical protein